MTDLLETPAWPDAGFQHYSKGSRHRLDIYDDGDPTPLMLAEITLELAARPLQHEALARKGLITDQEAQRELAILRAIAEDLADRHDAGAGVTWRMKVDFLRAEILHRRTAWLQDIRKGVLDREEAVRRLEALEWVQEQYWSWGWHMEGGLEAARSLSAHMLAHQEKEAA